ncbi:hydroxyacid dehydrogenase [Antribacter gilvus]|uniref:hydroxyacid dehydrogenase n=1 Tax=Antribacter gilvus TaxID=2304675 RepID=UPI001F0CD992|nr:hydroxyacid dehydrogenase [Antribacter gilvus]
MTARRPVAALAMLPDLPVRLFGSDAAERLGEVLDLLPGIMDSEGRFPGPVDEIEVLVAGWGAPLLDAGLLDRMPKLRAVVYTAGSTKGIMTAEAYARGVRVSTAAGANALPVAEFTLAAILLAGKRIFAISDEYRSTQDYRPPSARHARWGNNGVVAGIVGASRIGRRVIELLAPFDVEVLLYDPVAPDDVPGVTRVGLEELLRRSDVVSVHAPANAETHHMIDGAALALMRDGATLINTARGSLVDQGALVAELESRRLYAVIDVTDPDPLDAGSPLFSAPNLVLTPHIAGSQGNELLRLGDAALREAARYARGLEFADGVPESSLAHIA